MSESTALRADVRSQTLYRFWDHEGALLYVGISVQPWARWKQHAGEKPWWDDVAQVTLESFASREKVVAAESRAIRTELPRYNIMGAQMDNELIERLDRAGQAYAAAEAARDEALAAVADLAREAHGTVPIAQIAELGRVSRPTVYKMLAADKG